MRRKNWINKKRIFYDNLNQVKQIKPFFFNLALIEGGYFFDKYNTHGQLYDVHLSKTRNSFFMYYTNYYFYNFLIKRLRILNKKILYNNYLKSNKNFYLLSPNYTLKSQFFENRSLFYNLITFYKMKGFFLYKNFFKIVNYSNDKFIYKKHTIGYNFFILNKSFNNFIKLTFINDDKEYNFIGKVKMYINTEHEFFFFLKNELNIFINFNLYLLYLLEIYKIMLYVFFKNLNFN